MSKNDIKNNQTILYKDIKVMIDVSMGVMYQQQWVTPLSLCLYKKPKNRGLLIITNKPQCDDNYCFNAGDNIRPPLLLGLAVLLHNLDRLGYSPSDLRKQR